MLKSFRYLFLPIAFLYGGILKIRNWLYDKGIFKSTGFNFPIICVGNLAVGGTGKTPMVEYLADMLLPTYTVATLSRGYKRKTKGFAIAHERTTAIEIGDEPMQFHQKYPELIVSVGEERLVAIPQLLHQRPDTELIILDDAFQHRAVKAGLNILLTEYKNLYSRDFLLPAGDLRDIRSSSKRADIIVVTKCKTDLGEDERKSIIAELKPTADQKLYFSEIVYSQPYHLFNKKPGNINPETDVLLICGIANPKPLKEFLNKHVGSFDEMRFADHHIFSSTDLSDIKRHFSKDESPDKIILTTEKDAVRLQKFAAELSNYPIYVLPIKHRLLFNEAVDFENRIISFIQRFDKRNVN